MNPYDRTYFQSRRSAVVARNGAVATSQPLAAQAGMRILLDGGNAVDAAVGMAAALNVVEPMSTGIGGDMFALIWASSEKRVVALNGSGRAAAAANVDDVRRAGFDAIPNEGNGAAMAVSVPGTVHGWETVIDAYGDMSLREVLAPAIEYALGGYPVSEVIAEGWQGSEAKLSHRPSGAEMLPKNGRAPRYGEVVALPELGGSLQTIAEGGSEAFYKGQIAAKLAQFVQAEGGWLTEDDLASHTSDWDDAISTNYRGVEVWECPPNGQGIAALMALKIAAGFDISELGYQTADTYHHLIESMRLAYEDALQYVADPRVADVPIDAMLSDVYAAKRRGTIDPSRAHPDCNYGDPLGGGSTIYCTAMDGDGNACSLINSLFSGFGTGLVVPTTGIALQNRGSLFSFDPDHPNYLQGRKRPYQTIIPAMATRGDEVYASFGVMGGFQQPQGHLQVVSNLVDFGLDAQKALDALRFSIDVTGDKSVRVEEDLDADVVADLRSRGHSVEAVGGYDRTMFGGGQAITRDSESGVLTAGTEPRKDGSALGW